MTPAERKRAQELAILEAVYDLSNFRSVISRERPDFALSRSIGSKPLGVEVTQLFFHESHARFNLIAGYAHRLWSGGSHLHKNDVKTLKSVRVKISDAEGDVRYPDLPAVMMETPSIAEYRTALRDVILTKTGRGYDLGEFSHVNLVILDWFDLSFNATDYRTDRFFDDEVREALRECPFREVLLVLHNTARDTNDDFDQVARPDARIVPLQQLLAMERFYAAGHSIDKQSSGDLRDVAELNRLTIDHVSRVQGYGQPVECEGRPFLHYRGTLIELSDRGMQIRESSDSELPNYPTSIIPDRLEPRIEQRVTQEISANIFGFGFARPANRANPWEFRSIA
ncbi:hypothetical protein D7147_21795 [Micromonospora musae]|uniref:Uncharacterized protein n=2 Tax=Micromonospora musae TaxID=1894970 RepID=A0ABX9R2F0_9ACTN|nr:hypothetical protein D7147_21795 [Micromonospora musae]